MAHQYLRQLVEQGTRDVQVPHVVASNARTAVMSSAVQFDSRHEATASWNVLLAHKHVVSVLSDVPTRRVRIKAGSTSGGGNVQRAPADGNGRSEAVDRTC